MKIKFKNQDMKGRIYTGSNDCAPVVSARKNFHNRVLLDSNVLVFLYKNYDVVSLFGDLKSMTIFYITENTIHEFYKVDTLQRLLWITSIRSKGLLFYHYNEIKKNREIQTILNSKIKNTLGNQDDFVIWMADEIHLPYGAEYFFKDELEMYKVLKDEPILYRDANTKAILKHREEFEADALYFSSRHTPISFLEENSCHATITKDLNERNIYFSLTFFDAYKIQSEKDEKIENNKDNISIDYSITTNALLGCFNHVVSEDKRLRKRGNDISQYLGAQTKFVKFYEYFEPLAVNMKKYKK